MKHPAIVERDAAAIEGTHTRVHSDRTSFQRGRAELGVEVDARHDDGVTGIRLTGPRWKHHPPPGRPDDDHVADSRCVGRNQPEVLEESYTTRSDQVAACLVAS